MYSAPPFGVLKISRNFLSAQKDLPRAVILGPQGLHDLPRPGRRLGRHALPEGQALLALPRIFVELQRTLQGQGGSQLLAHRLVHLLQLRLSTSHPTISRSISFSYISSSYKPLNISYHLHLTYDIHQCILKHNFFCLLGQLPLAPQEAPLLTLPRILIETLVAFISPLRSRLTVHIMELQPMLLLGTSQNSSR